MQSVKHHRGISLLSFLIFFFAFILHYSDAFDISIKNATPLILLPLITAYSMFSTPTASAVAGLLTGICMDSAATGTLCFNAIIIMLSAVFVSVSSNNLFNKNILSVILLSFIICLVYFLARWGLFYAFRETMQDNLIYLLRYAFPSVVYTNIFIFPFFFLFRRFDRIKQAS